MPIFHIVCLILMIVSFVSIIPMIVMAFKIDSNDEVRRSTKDTLILISAFTAMFGSSCGFAIPLSEQSWYQSSLSQEITDTSSLNDKENAYTILKKLKLVTDYAYNEVHIIDQKNPGHFDLLPDDSVIEKIKIIKHDKTHDLTELTLLHGEDEKYKIEKQYALIPDGSLMAIESRLVTADNTFKEQNLESKNHFDIPPVLNEQQDMNTLKKLVR